MRCFSIGAAFLLLAGGCASQPLFNDADRSSATGHGVSARWLEELYHTELRSGTVRDADRTARQDVDGMPDAIDESSTLDDLIAFALANHPAVQAAYAEWVAARERIVQARTLPDPEISYGIMVEQIDRDKDPIGHSFGVSQMFPWFGKLDARAAVEIEAARGAQERLVGEQVRIARDVKEAWAEYAYAVISRDIVAQHLELLTSVEEVVRVRYRGALPGAGLADLLRVQQESDQLDVELRDLDDMLGSLRARVNAAIGRQPDAVLPAARTLPDVNREADSERTVTSLVERNPELRTQQAQIAQRRRAMGLARLDYYPDIMLGVEYGLNTARRMARMDGGGSNSLTGMVSITLPIWREKYDAGVRQALAEVGASLKTYSDRRNVLEADLKTVLYRLRDAERRIELFGDVLRTRGEQVLEATLAAYRVGDASFTDLVQAQRELITFELAHERALADRFTRLAEIDALLGRPITNSQPQSLYDHAVEEGNSP